MFQLWKQIFKPKLPKTDVERRVYRLERRVHKMMADSKRRNIGNAPIIIEKLIVKKIDISKLESSNNFGALGIRDLGGALNIGANYLVERAELPEEIKEKGPSKAENGQTSEKKEKDGNKPKVPKITFRPKKG